MNKTTKFIINNLHLILIYIMVLLIYELSTQSIQELFDDQLYCNKYGGCVCDEWNVKYELKNDSEVLPYGCSESDKYKGAIECFNDCLEWKRR